MMNKAVDYLGRYASSRHKLQQILRRFAARKLVDYDSEQITDAIRQTIDQCAKLGYIDDQEFAVTMARSQRRLGRSQSAIRQRLRQHALNDDIINKALAKVDEDCIDGDLQAAIRYAQRRRLGPFSNGANASHEQIDRQYKRQRDLGAMARAGFSMATSLKIIDSDDPDKI